jgi:predicted ester cyclase
MLVTLLISALPASAQDDMSDSHKETVRQLFDDVVNTGDADSLEDIFADDYVNHGLGDDMDSAAYVAYIDTLRNAMPDLTATLEVLIANDEWAASRVRFDGTFVNDWIAGEESFPANGEPIIWTVIILHHFDEDGRIIEDFTAFDELFLFCQLDADPLPFVLSALLCTREYAPINTDVSVEAGSVSDETLEAEQQAFLAVIEDAINNGDLTAIDINMADDYRTYEPFGSFTREAFREVIAGLRGIVPDLHVDIDALIIEDNWLATRLIYTGTVTGEIPLLGSLNLTQPTGKPIRLIINVMVHYDENGGGFEDFKEYNGLGWLRQLGILSSDDNS